MDNFTHTRIYWWYAQRKEDLNLFGMCQVQHNNNLTYQSNLPFEEPLRTNKQ